MHIGSGAVAIPHRIERTDATGIPWGSKSGPNRLTACGSINLEARRVFPSRGIRAVFTTNTTPVREPKNRAARASFAHPGSTPREAK